MNLRHSYEIFSIGEGYIQDEIQDEPCEVDDSNVMIIEDSSELSKLYQKETKTFDCEGSLSIFPQELYVHIFQFLDWKTLCKTACVCSAWHCLFEDYKTPLLKQREEKHTNWVIFLLVKALDQIEDIIFDQRLAEKREKERKAKLERRHERHNVSYSGCTVMNDDDDNDIIEDNKEFDMHSRTGTRIEFLKATILLLKDYFQKGMKAKLEVQATRNFVMSRPTTTALSEYVHLLSIINKQLLETTEILVKVRAGEITLNQNFDVIELSLRRYYAHFVLMFSPTGEASSLFQYPSEMIQDLQARQIWNTYVGHDKYFVDFEKFYDEVLLREMYKYAGRGRSNLNKEFRYYMKFFLNFPKDDIVTVSKWNLLTRLFGPYNRFYNNFTKYVLGHGFLGLVNRIRAEEILKDHPHCVLIRFSRTAPLVLAFSVSRGNYIQHYTNAPNQRVALGLPESKENIPINVFLKRQFPNANLVPMRVDGRLIASKETLSNYCSQVTGYVSIDH